MDILLIMQGLIYFERLLILQHCQIKIAGSNVVVFNQGTSTGYLLPALKKLALLVFISSNSLAHDKIG